MDSDPYAFSLFHPHLASLHRQQLCADHSVSIGGVFFVLALSRFRKTIGTMA
jgi:hypothetical protein